MPNLKNAVKQMKVSAKKRETNNDYKASMKTAIKNVEKAVMENNKEKAFEALKVAIKKIDKAVSNGVVHANKGSRDKSKLIKKVNAME